MAQPRLRALVRTAVAAAVLAAVALAPLSAQAADPVPLAARLLAEPYQNGTRVVVSNLVGMYGLATDGTLVYALNNSGNIVTVPLASLDLTPNSVNTVVGTIHPVAWGIGTAPPVPVSQLSITYSDGCLFITNESNTAGDIKLYCIDVTDWSITEIAVPLAYPLPVGSNYTYSNLLDLPDGRIGKVSRYEPVAGGYDSVLRTYALTGSGKNATLAFSEDFTFFDTTNWATDEHGVASDGTYLYRIQYRTFNPNFKSWKLVSGATSTVEYEGAFTEPFSNMHFLAHNHLAHNYLVGIHSGNSFYITPSADAGPGPGSALTPSFGTMTSTTGGCTNTVTNYDAAFTWAASAGTGTAAVDSLGAVTVSGLAAGASTTVTVQATRSSYPNGSSTFSCVAAPADPPGAPTAVTAKAEDERASFGWTAPTHAGTGGIFDYTAQVRTALGVDVPGATCTTTLVYCSVDGLSNGTSYQVVVRAKNIDGYGPWSASTAFTPAVPVLTPLGSTSSNLTVSDQTPIEGDTITLTASGFRPGSQVDFWIRSTPTLLGSVIVNNAGVAALSVPLPAGFTGAHSIQALGISTAGVARNLTQPITIAARPTALAFSGSDVAPWGAGAALLLAAGLVLIATRRRRVLR